MGRLAGRVALVTGAAGGIGLALCRRLAEEGADVLLADLPGDRLDAAAEAVGGVPFDVDVADEADMLALRDRVGVVDVLCNNAGVIGPLGDPLWELPFSEWERVLRVNLWGVLHGIRAFVPEMLTSRHDCYVMNTASMQGVTAGTTIPEYAISKHAVVALSELLRNQLAERRSNVHVSVLLPGGVSTGLAAREHERLGDSPLEPPTVIPATLTPPEDVAAIAVDAMLARRFWIFTHPGSRERVQERVEDLLSGFN